MVYSVVIICLPFLFSKHSLALWTDSHAKDPRVGMNGFRFLFDMCGYGELFLESSVVSTYTALS